MSAPAYLPMHPEQAGRHLFVRMVDPAAMDDAAPFFRDGLPRDAQGQSMVPLAGWLAEQPAPERDYSDVSTIFQVSRCGSTLLARNIAQHDGALVLKEPPFFSALHGRFNAIGGEAAAMRLSLAILEPWRALAKAQRRRLVLKLSSSLNPHMHAVLEAMPGARALALHREPLAVLESLDRKPSTSLAAAVERAAAPLLPDLRGLEDDRSLLIAADRYIRSLCAMQAVPAGVLRVDYEDLARSYPAILDHLGVDPRAAPPWSSTRDAKARAGEGARQYTPVARARLEQFARRNAHLLAIARGHHEALRAGATPPREANTLYTRNPIEHCI